MRRLMVVMVPLVFALQLPVAITAQEPPQDDDWTIERYQETLRDLVEQYEVARNLLVEVLGPDTPLESVAPDGDAVAFGRSISELDRELKRLSDENRRLQRELEQATAMALDTKRELVKREGLLETEVATLRTILGRVDGERVFDVMITASPSGEIGGFGRVNFPGTGFGLGAGASWDLREQSLKATIGLSFSFLSYARLSGLEYDATAPAW